MNVYLIGLLSNIYQPISRYLLNKLWIHKMAGVSGSVLTQCDELESVLMKCKPRRWPRLTEGLQHHNIIALSWRTARLPVSLNLNRTRGRFDIAKTYYMSDVSPTATTHSQGAALFDLSTLITFSLMMESMTVTSGGQYVNYTPT